MLGKSLDKLLEEAFGQLEVSLEVVRRVRVPLSDVLGHVLDLDQTILVAELLVQHVDGVVVGGRLVVCGHAFLLE